MNLDALGNIGDFVGGIAVIATLVYLAIQIRQNTRQVQQSVELARVAAVKGANMVEPSTLAVAQDGELARIVREGLADPSCLSPDDRVRFTMWMGAMISSIAVGVTEQTMLGLSRDEVGDSALPLKGFLVTPGGREYWQSWGTQYPGAFQRFVNEHILGDS